MILTEKQLLFLKRLLNEKIEILEEEWNDSDKEDLKTIQEIKSEVDKIV